MDKEILAKANEWLKAPYSIETQKSVQQLIDNNEAELVNAFYKELEFGTGGLRGIMGVGTNRMNTYNLQKVTQGLSNYLIQCFSKNKTKQTLQVAIAYDCRNNSSLFAKTTAQVFASNGIKVYLFSSLRTTPQLSFAVRLLQCQAGIVITASHNPKEYNGYKVYWQDGGQIIAPHDKNIIAEVNKITSLRQVKTNANSNLISSIGKEVDEAYHQKIIELCTSFSEATGDDDDKTILHRNRNVKIIYTPIHGSGLIPITTCLQTMHFDVAVVEAQKKPDGNFPTVESPNPEEGKALSMAIAQAIQEKADLVIGTDPDTDRVGIAVPSITQAGDYQLLNGNESAVLLVYFLLTVLKNKNKLASNQYIVKTIVTTDLIEKIANSFDIETLNVLTGFKYIAALIDQRQHTHTFLYGCEESYGYLVGDFVRDKDAVITSCLFAMVSVWAKAQKKSLLQLLIKIYHQHGFYLEKLIAITKPGKDGSALIESKMKILRANCPTTLSGIKVAVVKDYLTSVEHNLSNGKKTSIDLPKSNVLQFLLEDESLISVRPSGTEPKIKFYISVNSSLASTDTNTYLNTKKKLETKITHLLQSAEFTI